MKKSFHLPPSCVPSVASEQSSSATLHLPPSTLTFGRACLRSAKLKQAWLCSRLIAAFLLPPSTLHLPPSTLTFGRACLRSAKLKQAWLCSRLIAAFLLPPSTLLLPLLLLSCEKEIPLDYHQVEPLYVVEASISNEGTEVRISRTNHMDDNSSNSDISDAIVTVTEHTGAQGDRPRVQIFEEIGKICTRGLSPCAPSAPCVIPYARNGYYRDYSLKGVPGMTYTLDVELDGHHFTSTSTMQREPVLNSFSFEWMEVASERILFGDLRIQDIKNEDNWYFIHIYRNGIGYRWAVMRDDQNPNKELQQLFTFFREGSNDSDVLREGDQLHIEIRAIDQRAYDYLYSMQLMDNTGTNPIQNFTGGCLGYFSAYHQITYDCIYNDTRGQTPCANFRRNLENLHRGSVPVCR